VILVYDLYLIATTVVTLSVLEGHFSIASFSNSTFRISGMPRSPCESAEILENF